MTTHHFEAQGPYCGARSIQYKIENDAIWVKSRTSNTANTTDKGTINTIDDDDPYYNSCKFIHARYNCTRFNNSATHYKLDFRSRPTGSSSNLRSKCRLPSRHSIIRILERRPINIFFVGDSHVQQIFESIICTFQDHIKDIMLYEREQSAPKTLTPGLTKESAFGRTRLLQYSNHIINNNTINTIILNETISIDSNDTSSSSSLSDLFAPTASPTISPEIMIAKVKVELDTFHRNFYPDYKHCPECHTIAYEDYEKFGLTKVTNVTGECTLSHVAGQVSCAKIYAVNYTNPLAYSWLCFSYVRPLKGSDGIDFAFNHSVNTLNTSINRFDVIVANTYVSGSKLSKYLKDRQYNGRVLAVPKFPFGNQSNTVITNHTISETPIDDEDEYYKSSENTKKFCNTFGWAKINGIDKCNVLDFTRLIYQRNLDSKSSIFPLSYSENGTDHICQIDQFSENNCLGKNFKVCSSKYCNEESHFCMPGPTDALSMVVLAAALSHIDHNGQFYLTNFRNTTNKINALFPRINTTSSTVVSNNITYIQKQLYSANFTSLSPIYIFLIGLMMGLCCNSIFYNIRKLCKRR